MRGVILTDVPGLTVSRLSEATLEAAAQRPDFQVSGFVTSRAGAMFPSRHRRVTRALRRGVVSATGGPRRQRTHVSIPKLAQRHGLPILTTESSVNDPAFIDRLHDELAPDVILSFFCLEILRAGLLNSVRQAVNYHDGLLPDYGGLVATSQSLGHRESRSGYTFHRMTVELDAGPILFRGSVPVPPDATAGSITRAKALSAATAIPSVLDMIEAEDPGRPQTGAGSYFNAADYVRLSTVPDPGLIDAEELDWRLRACGTLMVTINGTPEAVTEIEDHDGDGPFAFVTGDGRQFVATRIGGIPAGLIAARRHVRSVAGF